MTEAPFAGIPAFHISPRNPFQILRKNLKTEVKREPYILFDDFEVFDADSMFDHQHGGSTFDVDYFLPGNLPDDNMFG